MSMCLSWTLSLVLCVGVGHLLKLKIIKNLERMGRTPYQSDDSLEILSFKMVLSSLTCKLNKSAYWKI